MTKKEFRRKIENGKKTGRPLCFAHRGASGLAKGGSIKAVRLAMQIKETDGIEFDIQETKNGKLIVCHDSAIKTDTGYQWVKELTLSEIRNFISEDDAPTLQEMFDVLQNWRGILDIEIKQEGITKKVIDLCKKRKVYENVVLTTVYPEIFKEITKNDGSVACIFGYPRDRGKNLAGRKWAQPVVRLVVPLIRQRLKTHINTIMRKADTPFISLYHKVISRTLVNSIHQKRNYCLGATISLRGDTGEKESIKAMASMLNDGADLIKTDYPNLYPEALKLHKSANPVR